MIKFDLKRFMNLTRLKAVDLAELNIVSERSIFNHLRDQEIGVNLARVLKKNYSKEYNKCLNDTIG